MCFLTICGKCGTNFSVLYVPAKSNNKPNLIVFFLAYVSPSFSRMTFTSRTLWDVKWNQNDFPGFGKFRECFPSSHSALDKIYSFLISQPASQSCFGFWISDDAQGWQRSVELLGRHHRDSLSLFTCSFIPSFTECSPKFPETPALWRPNVFFNPPYKYVLFYFSLPLLFVRYATTGILFDRFLMGKSLPWFWNIINGYWVQDLRPPAMRITIFIPWTPDTASRYSISSLPTNQEFYHNKN